MDIPGYTRAGRRFQLRFSNETSQMIHEKSVFLRLCKQRRLIYANRHSAVQGEALSEASDLRQFSHGVAIPIIDYGRSRRHDVTEVAGGHSISTIAASDEGEESE